jgi:peptidoglycan hydrolase-like protein with peptidoglycan-binding domain
MAIRIDLKTILTEEGWDKAGLECKGKDKELKQTLLSFWALDDDGDFDLRCKTLGKLATLAGNLKSVVGANRDAVNYLVAMINATKTRQGEILKAKAEALKADAEAKKKEALEAAHEAKHGAEAEEEEEESGDAFAKLTKILQSLKTSKEPFHFIYCKDKPYGLVVAKRDISKSAQHKKELSQMAGGSTTAPRCGQCRREGNKLILDMEDPIPGMARILQKWINDATSLGLKVMVGTESADDDAGSPAADSTKATAPAAPPEAKAKPAAFISASVGKQGKNKPEDVKAVQEALNSRVKAGLPVDGKCGPATLKAIEGLQKQLGKFKPDGLIEPGRATARALAGNAKIGPPPAPPKTMAPPKLEKPTLAKAPAVWRGMREFVDKNVKALKQGIRAEYGAEHPNLLKEIDENLVKLDVVIDKLDTRLSDSLEKAYALKDEAARKAVLKNSKTILAEYIEYLKKEPLIAHMDNNPFGVDTKLGKTIKDHLTHVAQAIG